MILAACFCILVIGAMFAHALRLRPALPADARLPMQWSLTGRPTWTAPRDIGLFFLPAFSMLTLGFMAALFALMPSEPTAKDALPWILGATALLLGLTQIIHLHFAVKHAQR